MSDIIGGYWFSSEMSGAPSLTGIAGSLVTLLDRCLVAGQGFGSVTLDSLVVADGVATATCSTGHNFKNHVVVLVAGAVNAALNGEQRIVVTSPTQFEFPMIGVANGAASGSITAKMAPLGWSKPFSGNSKGAYLPKTWYCQQYLQCLDNAPPSANNAKVARMRGFESMSGVDTGEAPFPTVAQSANGLQWIKSYTLDMLARPWLLFGDGGVFYLFTASSGTTLTRLTGYAFGDIGSALAADEYCTLICGEPNDALPVGPWDYPMFVNCVAAGTTQGGKFLARNYLLTQNPAAAGCVGSAVYNGVMGYSGVPYPQPSGLLYSDVSVFENTGGAMLRAKTLPGLLYPLHARPLAENTFFTLDTGEVVYVVGAAGGGGSTPNAQVFINLTGAWRE